MIAACFAAEEAQGDERAADALAVHGMVPEEALAVERPLLTGSEYVGWTSSATLRGCTPAEFLARARSLARYPNPQHVSRGASAVLFVWPDPVDGRGAEFGRVIDSLPVASASQGREAALITFRGAAEQVARIPGHRPAHPAHTARPAVSGDRMRSLSLTTRFLFAFMAMTPLAVTPGAATAGIAQELVRTCPDGTAPRADLGIRFRFMAGDFVHEEGRPRWVHFFSEPVVIEVNAGGPAAGSLLPGDHNRVGGRVPDLNPRRQLPLLVQ